jgi:hypothetical protein
LNELFAANKRADGRKYTNTDVAAYVSTVTGRVCSRKWVARVRDGEAPKLDLDRLDAVAAFFSTTGGYLLGDEDDATQARDREEDHAIATLAKELDAKGVRLRQLGRLEPEDLDLVGDLIQRLTNAQDQRQRGSD